MIIRRNHTANFTTIGNKLFDDERLSADEIGILAYLRSRPHDWEVRRPALARRWKMGREAIKRVMTNLIATGWCRAEKARRPDGTYYMIYEIRDEPGATLTEEDVRRALSLVSSEAGTDEIEGNAAPDDASDGGDPPTGYPSLVDPSTVDPSLAYKSLPNKELTKDDSTQKLEREGAREKTKHAANLVVFKSRYPTTATDDQTKIDRSWFDLSAIEGDAAIAGIPLFLAELKRNHRKYPPAAWKYLGEKRWTLIEAAAAVAKSPTVHARGSIEARALGVLFKIVGASDFFHAAVQRGSVVSFPLAITPQLAALAQAPPSPSDWPELTRQQAGAWEALIPVAVKKTRAAAGRHLAAGSRAPWPWPPSVEGKIYPITGPPGTLMTAEDETEEFR